MAELPISDLIKRYSERCTENNVFLTEGKPVCVRGNVVSVRKHGKISFMTLSDKDGELQLVLRDKIDPFPTPKSNVTAAGYPGKTSTGQLSLLVHQLAINELAPPNIPPPRQTQRQRKRHVSRGEQLVVDRADALYGSLFPLGETDEASADINFGSLDPTLNIPDQDDKRRLAWADRKRPQVAWMIEKVRELLDRRKTAGLRSFEILVCAKRAMPSGGPKVLKEACSTVNRFRFNLNITTLIRCNNTVLCADVGVLKALNKFLAVSWAVMRTGAGAGAGMTSNTIIQDIGGGRGDLAVCLAAALAPSVHVTVVDINATSVQVCVD
jgi:hypothetical protein